MAHVQLYPRALTRLGVDDALAVKLRHRKAKALEYLRVGRQRLPAHFCPTKESAFWFNVVQLYIFWALPCALLWSPEGFARFSAHSTDTGENAVNGRAPDL